MEIKIIESILISIIIIFIYILYIIKKNRLTLVKANNNINFMVYNDENKIESANLLGTLVDRMYKLRNNLINNKNKNEEYEEYEEYINLLEKNLNTERTFIYENIPDSNLTSFTINKGEELGFCLKSKVTSKFHDINLLMYVAIHEMAHVACPEVGHNNLFKKIFMFFTIEAINMGLYKKIDYESNNIEYCGMILSSSIV
jgi:predicted metal-dependent hydrolase